MSAKAGSKSKAQSSAKSSSPAKVSKTRKKASDLEKEIIQLQDQLEQVQEQLAVRTENYEQVVKKIVTNCNCELFDVDETTDVLSLVIDDVMEMLSSILTRTYGDEDTIEVRVEELETRVTKQNIDIARLTKGLLNTQYVLEDISRSNDMMEIKRMAADAIKKLGQTVSESSHEADQILYDDALPMKRLPGTTHINNMKQELRYLVIKEVSFTKTSGRDWRLFGERVGVSNEVIDRLRHMRVQYPMAKILTVWGESPGATVRMLHRHLVSTQLGFSLLGKHLADVYEVD